MKLNEDLNQDIKFIIRRNSKTPTTRYHVQGQRSIGAKTAVP